MFKKIVGILICMLFIGMSYIPDISGKINDNENKTYGDAQNNNQPPSKPTKPSGPTLGHPGHDYVYSTVATDPDGNNIFYLWDWGDGSSTIWLGPYNPNATIEHAYIWAVVGKYFIKVKAIDDPNGDNNLSDGTESEWSDSLEVNISSDSGFIGEVSGGLGLKTSIHNNGTATLYNVTWSIDVEHNTIGLILSGSHTEDVIDVLEAGSSTTIKSNGLKGIGPITITIQANDVSKQATAFLLGPLVLRMAEL